MQFKSASTLSEHRAGIDPLPLVILAELALGLLDQKVLIRAHSGAAMLDGRLMVDSHDIDEADV